MQESEAIQTEGNVAYYAAASTVVYVKTPSTMRKLCRIEFSRRDGSIMVPFPYLESKRGVLSHVTDQAPEGGPYTYDLAKDGVVTEYDVKFTHHRSGIAQFSRTGSDDLLPRRRSFSLDIGGMVFQLQVHSLEGLAEAGAPRKKDLYLAFSFPQEHPIGVKLYAEWRRKDDIGNSASPPGVEVGPRSDAIKKSTGALMRFAFLGQPDGFPCRDHLLLLSISPVPAIAGADVPTMVFLGGLDPHERTPAQPEPRSDGFLSFLFPYLGSGARAPDRRPG